MFGHKVAKFSMSFSNPGVSVVDQYAWGAWLEERHRDGDRRVAETVTYSSPVILQDVMGLDAAYELTAALGCTIDQLVCRADI